MIVQVLCPASIRPLNAIVIREENGYEPIYREIRRFESDVSWVDKSHISLIKHHIVADSDLERLARGVIIAEK